MAGKSGIGHTRWATHGTPSVKNAHPHQAGDVAVVHNGIIENFVELRAELNSYKIKHKTDTDTETVALMAKHYLSQGFSPTEVVKKTLLKLKGAFALAFLFQGEDDLMIVARQGSPLAIGHGNGEMYVGSDAIALAHLTNKITYLDEGDFAKITRKNLEITDKSGNLVTRKNTQY